MNIPAPHVWTVVDREEFIRLMGCSAATLDELEAVGEVFSVSTPGEGGSRRYPVFQLNSDLDKALLKKTIAMYREADVSYAKLWSFLRSPRRENSDKTMVEILLGALPAAEIGMSVAERAEAILDIVAEELSRVRW